MQSFFDAQQDWTGGHNPVAVQQRKEVLKYLRPQRHELLAMMLRAVRNRRAEFTDRYLSHLADRLEPESMVGITPNLRQLLTLAKRPGETPLDIRRRYEAIRFFDEAMAMMLLERSDPIHDIYANLMAFLGLMERHLFKHGSEEVTIWTGHDRGDSHRVKQFSIGTPLWHDHLLLRENRITCRKYEDQRGHIMLIALHHRIKQHYATLLKMVKQWHEGKPDYANVTDRCGLKLVVPDESTALALDERIVEIVEDAGGRVVLRRNTLTADDGRPNHYSSPHFKAIMLRLLWHKRHYEIQITTFPCHYSSELAVDEENHLIYRLLQCFGHYFPWMFPANIYGIDWADESLQREIMAFQIVSLGWRVNRRTLPIHPGIS